MIIVPAGADTLVICHWAEDGHWETLNIPHPALAGHSQHALDIWPAVAGVTPGLNWPAGSEVYLAGCMLVGEPTPSPSPSASASEGESASPSVSASGSLPPTGAAEILSQTALAVGLILTGAWLKWLRPR